MFRMMNKLKNRKGFTLIELIVVLAVLAIIMAIAVPRFLGVQADAKTKADVTTLENIARAGEMYYIQEDLTGAASGVDISDLIPEYLDGDYKFQTTAYSALNSSSSGITYNGNGQVTSIGTINVD